MRVAIVDAYGETLNAYSQLARIAGPAPQAPWAVNLAGTDHAFRLLAFDLDARADPAQAQRDAERIAGLLTDAGIPHLMCESGPSGGRHVWAALAEAVDADAIATLARLLRHLCPSLDIAPLTNAPTGCVRPPGAPHRSGGHSTVLSGDVDVLTRPTATAAHVRALLEHVVALVDDTAGAELPDPGTPIPVDAHGRLYLPGRRRELPAGSAAALDEDMAGADASAVLWRVLIGAAAARWRHADIAVLVATRAGLEHVRTRATPTGRRPRPLRGASGQAEVLARDWDRAVRHIAANPRRAGDDPTFDARADAIAAHVRALQERARAAGGRWAHRGGPADRRVLDVLCILALRAVSADLEADIRRLGLMAGVGRETARTALHRLADDGWIHQVRAADGPHGAHWTINPQRVLHRNDITGRSQADTRPSGAGSAERTALLAELTIRTEAAAHDLFTTGPALGHLAGNLYSCTTPTPQSVDELTHTTGISASTTRRLLHRLTRAGVVDRDRGGWRRAGGDLRDAAAEGLGVAGRLADRAVRYQLERDVWAWWLAEEAWMQAPRRTHHSRRAGPHQLTLLPENGTNVHGAYPRRGDGVADHRAARAARAGQSQPAAPVVDDPWAVEAILAHVLGATRVA